MRRTIRVLMPDILPPLTKAEFKKFCYHFAMATRAYQTVDPPDDYLEELIGFGARLILEYTDANRERWGLDEGDIPMVV